MKKAIALSAFGMLLLGGWLVAETIMPAGAALAQQPCLVGSLEYNAGACIVCVNCGKRWTLKSLQWGQKCSCGQSLVIPKKKVDEEEE